MCDYQNLWHKFRTIQESTRKKLLKKPNYNEAIAQYRSLCQEMEDAEMPEHAAACEREISALYDKLQNPAASLQHLLKSARLFYSARMVRFEMNFSTMQENEMLMEDCFLKAIERLTGLGFKKLAAFTLLEVAEIFQNLKNYERAYYYYLKGSRFLQTDVYASVNVLNQLCALSTRQSCFEEVLSDLQAVWSSLLKETACVGTMRETLAEIECHIAFLHLKHVLFTDDFQRSILVQYNGQWRHLKQSLLDRDEFMALSRFIGAVRARDHAEAERVYAFLLVPMLLQTDGARKTCAEIVDSIDDRPPIEQRIFLFLRHHIDVVHYNFVVFSRGFGEILNATQCSEAEKRQKLFEFYNGVVRKKEIKFEYL